MPCFFTFVRHPRPFPTPSGALTSKAQQSRTHEGLGTLLFGRLGSTDARPKCKVCTCKAAVHLANCGRKAP
eukprot:788455-Amorphochlora_amoeboformis.AAC.1